jgi:glycogen debranching enzyme
VPTPNAVEFDVRAIPFSTRGAWLDISPVVGLHEYAEDLHLVAHRNGHRNGLTPVLRLRPWRKGAPVSATPAATSSVLTWVGASGTIEAVFDGPDVVRLRGRGLGLRLQDAAAKLTPFTGTYLYLDPATADHVFTSYETGLRYRVTVLAGVATVEGAGALGAATRALTVEDHGGGWEVAIEEFRTARPGFRPEAGFDHAVANADADFAAYLDRIVPWRNETTPAAALAAYVLWSATVAAEGFLRRESVLMSMHWMDKVWSWDHCFNALALAEGEPEHALDQFLAPFDHQTAEGALPDSISHSEVLYNYVKPPIHGWTFEQLRPLLGTIDRQVLEQVRDRLAAWTRFWLDHRRAPGSALPYYQHGNDSGWDNSTTFDHDRVIESPDLAAFLVVQLDALAGLEEQLDNPEAAAAWREDSQQMLAALLTLWAGDAFVARSASTGEPSDTSSLLNLLPLILGERLPDQQRRALRQRLQGHMTSWGPATEPPTSPHYEADGYWRGPIWAPSTVLIEDGLRRGGETEAADDVSAKFRKLCEVSGFAENFDALTGEGLRDRAYTWTASAYLRLAAAAVRRGGPATQVPTASGGDVHHA